MIRTKIICTIGPATREPEMLKRLMDAGMDVARLNMSHGSQEFHAENVARIRAASEEVGKPVAILADLQGPKLRVGQMPDSGMAIRRGETIQLTTDDITGYRVEGDGDPRAMIPIQYDLLPRDVKHGENILLDDGLLEMQILDTDGEANIRCEVVTGGILRSRKGLNLPGTDLSLPAITEKDWADLDFLIGQEVDWLALSFVRRADEVIELKHYIESKGARIRVIAKIEKPEALTNMDEIIAATDGIMVARGDLGIEIPAEKVPVAQKRLIHASNKAGKPVITATQMLDSMIRNPRPTRAEASDVANAILDGTDAIMLSGETATGHYPLEAVRTMVRIAQEVEGMMLRTSGHWTPPHHVTRKYGDTTDAVAISSCETAFDLRAGAIITSTASGMTARAVARYRPQTPIIAVTPHVQVQRQLMLSWGVHPLLGGERISTDRLLRDALSLAAQCEMVNEGDKVVITAGVANNLPGATNLMLVEVVSSQDDKVVFS